MTSPFGVGGFGSFGGRFDEKLNEKVEQLVGGSKQQTREERLNEQLRAMGIDPDKLPLKPEDAKRHTWAFIGSWDDFDEQKGTTGDPIEFSADWLELVGSSLGFSKVIVHGKGVDYSDYDESTSQYPNHDTQKSLTSRDLDAEKWRDLERVWEAFKEQYGNRVRVYAQYTRDEPEAITIKFSPDPKKLKQGQTARLQKGDELVYVRVGGLWGDDEITNLKTMAPIEPLTGWKVVEVLED